MALEVTTIEYTYVRGEHLMVFNHGLGTDDLIIAYYVGDELIHGWHPLYPHIHTWITDDHLIVKVSPPPANDITVKVVLP